MINKILLAVIAMLTCISCQDFVHKERIVGDFFLVAVDSDQEMDISYKISNDGDFIGVVPATVYSIGHDSLYIYAKQHPDGPDGKTNYYIIPIEVQHPYNVEEGVIGPLDKNQFYKKLDEFKVVRRDDLFQTTIENL